MIMSSVLRSHFVEVGESQSECHTAVLKRRGTLGRMRRAIAAGEDVSIFLKVYQDAEKGRNTETSLCTRRKKAREHKVKLAAM